MTNIHLIIKILSIKGIGRKTARILIENLYPGISNDNELSEYLFQSKIKQPHLNFDRIRKGIDRGNYIISESEKLNISFVDFQSPMYPMQLNQIKDPPLLLSYIGDLRILKSNCIALVGTREPSIKGYEDGYRYGKILAQKGFTIVNGLARGSDTAVIKGCMNVRGKAAVVLANGLNTIYPSENKKLSEEVFQNGGLIISESFIGETINIGSFLQRNRIQVGLCKVVLIIETKVAGGTIETVRICMKNNRKVGCLINADEDRVGNLSLQDNPEIISLCSEKDVLQLINENYNL